MSLWCKLRSAIVLEDFIFVGFGSFVRDRAAQGDSRFLELFVESVVTDFLSSAIPNWVSLGGGTR